MKQQRFFDEQLEQQVHYRAGVAFCFLVVNGLLLAAVLGTLGWYVSMGRFPFETVTYLFTFLVLLHAISTLGWQRALTYFGITFVITWLLEHVGVKTGWIFGHYCYTKRLWPQIFHTVPIVIPMAYFMVIYPSGQMANLLLRGRVNAPLQKWTWQCYAALLTALIMTAWDLVMDTVMIQDTVKAWVWRGGGDYFGVPFKNFLGWTVTTFVCSSAYRLLEPRLPGHPLAKGDPLYLALPLMGYAALMGGALLIGTPLDTRVIAPYAMGVPLLGALILLFRKHSH